MNLQEVKELMAFFDSTSLSRVNLDMNGVRIELEKISTSANVLPASTNVSISKEIVNEVIQKEIVKEEVTAQSIEDSCTSVASPLVGVFYVAPSPSEPPYVKVGDTVKKGDTLCLVEAMKTMNEIKAPIDGVIKQVQIEDGELVEFNQSMILIQE